MTYTFVHRFKDKSVGVCWIEHPSDEIDDLHIEVPPYQNKSWHREFRKWMEQAILPFVTEKGNRTCATFQFLE